MSAAQRTKRASESNRRADESYPIPAATPAIAVVVGALLLIAMSFAVFGSTLGHGFVWDDWEQVRDNPIIRDPGNFWEFWHRDILDLSRQGGNHFSNYYRPLFYVHYLINYQLFGLNTIGWHAMAIMQHALASIAAMVLAMQLGLRLRHAWIVAALFCLHPAHGESVSWVAAAFNDPPAATLLMLGLAAHIQWRKSGRATWLIPALLAYAGALCHKESALSMLMLVPLVDWYVDQSRSLVLRACTAVPLALLLATMGVLAGRAQVHWNWSDVKIVQMLSAFPGAALAVGVLIASTCHRNSSRRLAVSTNRDVRNTDPSATNGDFAPPAITALSDRRWALLNLLPYVLLTMFYFIVRQAAISTVLGRYPPTAPAIGTVLPTLPSLAVFYARLLVWPFGYAPSYDHRYMSWSDTQTIISCALLLAMAAALAITARRRRVILFGAVWVLFCIWPAFNIRSFIPYYLAHQRYLYLAVFGVCFAIYWAITRLLRTERSQWFVLAGIALVWNASNIYYNQAWKDDVTLWTRIGQADPGNAAAFDFLGFQHLKAGELAQAEAMYLKAIAADPDYPSSYAHLASLLDDNGTDRARTREWMEKTQAVFERILKDRPEKSGDFASFLNRYGRFLVSEGDIDRGLSKFLRATSIQPYSPAAAANAALLLHQQNRNAEAERLMLSNRNTRKQFRAAINIKPDQEDLLLLKSLVTLYERTGQAEKARPFIAEAEQLQAALSAIRR